MMFTVTAQILTTAPGGWSGSRQVPTFFVEGFTEAEAAAKAAAVLTTTGGKAYVSMLADTDHAALHNFVAEDGTAANLHALPLV